MTNCIYCGKEISAGSTFCAHCGKKQTQIYTQTFCREKMSEDQFVDKINEWFAKYPNVANVQGEFLTGSGFGLLVNKHVLNGLAIRYEIMDGVNQYQYGVVNLSCFGLVKTSCDALLAQWKQKNPNAIVIKTAGGVHQRGGTTNLMLGGIGAANKTQLYVLFKIPRS